MKKTVAVLLGLALAASLALFAAGCQTVKGLGKDIESLGQEIQK